KLHDAETRYSTYNQDLIGSNDMIYHWRFYFNGDIFKVQTDNSALEQTIKQPRLTGR
ncbi:hypothetical protein K440DRAFT_573497, partial [Wilcoxina mikolae CBS 423.85]